MEELNIPHEDGKTRLFPRLIDLECVSHESLVSHVSKHSAFERGVVEGVLMRVAECLGEMMGSRGASVHINGLGIFCPRLTMKKRQEAGGEEQGLNRRNARSICVGGVNFRPDKELVLGIDDNCNLQHSPYRDTIRPNASPYTQEERRARLVQYLSETPFIGGRQYSELTAMPLTSARKELRGMTEGDGALLCASGRGSHRIYTLRQ